MKIATSRGVIAALLVTAWTQAIAVPETFVIDNNHTFPRFSYSHFGYSTQLSRFDKTRGRIVLDTAARTGSVEVTIDTKSVDTGVPLLNEHIQDEGLLDTAHYPTATFNSTAVRFDGDRPAAIDGKLTLNGITRPVTLTVRSFQHKPNPMLKKDAIGANASVTVKRSDFKAAKFAPGVSDEVTIDIAVEAYKE